MSRAGGTAGLLSDRQVDLIAMRLAERLTGAPPPPAPVTSSTTLSAPAVVVPHNPAAPAIAPQTRPAEKLGEGVFATVDDAVDQYVKGYVFDAYRNVFERSNFAVNPPPPPPKPPNPEAAGACRPGAACLEKFLSPPVPARHSA